MEYSLCIEPVLPEMDFYDRITAASELGFDAIEFWDPAKRDIQKVASYAAKSGISIAACCMKSPGMNTLSSDSNDFCDALIESSKLAKYMGCPSLIILSGNTNTTIDQKNIIIDNLNKAASIAHKEDICLLIEPLNSLIDHKGYYLDSSRLAFDLIRHIGSSSIKVLFDCYHMCIMQEDVVDTIKNNICLIGHFHAAGVPGRHEPLTTPPYTDIIKTIMETGYDGYFGLEYLPSYDHIRSLGDVLKSLKNI